MYDPKDGRWAEEDPIKFAGGDTNLYRFVNNSPTNYTDPTGTHLVGAYKSVAEDYLKWLRNEDGVLKANWGPGPGLKNVNIYQAPSGRWIFIAQDSGELQRGVAAVKNPFDKATIAAINDPNKDIVLRWRQEPTGVVVKKEDNTHWDFYKEDTALSFSEKQLINYHLGDVYSDVVEFNRSFTHSNGYQTISTVPLFPLPV